jgi:hypothetical protein
MVSENIFEKKINDMMALYNKSLLTRISSDSVFGNIDDPFYYLCDFHPATRNYLEQVVSENGLGLVDKVIEKYGDKFVYYYYELASNIYQSWDKEIIHQLLMAQFNIITTIQKTMTLTKP